MADLLNADIWLMPDFAAKAKGGCPRVDKMRIKQFQRLAAALSQIFIFAANCMQDLVARLSQTHRFQSWSIRFLHNRLWQDVGSESVWQLQT
jgi:hypothetical protein